MTSTFKTSHCQQTANSARRILFQLRRGFAVLTPEIFRPLYLALVRPILEYGQQASSPYLRRDIALMERIQRLATCMIKSITQLPYEDRLRRLNVFGLILAHNIFHGHLDLPWVKFLRRHRSETFEDTTSSCAIAGFVYPKGKQPTK